MPFDKIIGQEGAKKILKNSLDKGRTVNAYIFSGPDGVGKYLTTRFLQDFELHRKGQTLWGVYIM